MRFESTVTVRGVKASSGEMEGRAFSSTTFHCDLDLKENGSGKAIGIATRPFKIPDHKEFDKWEHVPVPCEAKANFEMKAVGNDKSEMVLIGITPPATKKA